MATRNFNVKNGLTAGNITLDATTNTTTTANLVVTGNANLTAAANVALGSNSNVKLTGGSSGQYLQTDGAGNLSWQTVSVSANSISNGTSNVRIPVANGNVVVSVNGTANTATFTSNAVLRGTYGLTGAISQANTAPSNPQNGDQWYNTFNGILFEYLDDGTSSQWVDISSLPTPNLASSNAGAVLNNVQTTGTYFPAFISSTANANYALSSNTAFSANFANGAMIATTFVGALSGAATTAGTVTTAAQPNITSVGTLTSLSVTGNATAGNVYANSGTIGASLLTGTLTTAAQPNITSVGTLTSLNVTGNANTGNLGTTTLIATTGNITTINSGLMQNGNSNVTITANANVTINAVGGARITATSTGANVTGTLGVSGNANVGNLGTAQVLATANITTPQLISNVATGTAPLVVTSTTQVANLSVATAGSATTAGTVTTAAQPNITSVGTLTSLGVNGTVTAVAFTANTGVFTGNANGLSSIQGANVVGTVSSATSATTAGTVTTAAQPNITSVGTLTSLSVTGNVAAGNLTTTGVLSVTGTGVSSIAGNLDMTSNTIINLATPTNASDAATKQYVDDVAQGLNIHDSVAAATSTTLATTTGGTITYNNGSSGVGANLVTTGTFNLIDGVNVQTAGTRILVKNEANAVHNGIYTWSNATVITRATDYDTVPEVEAGDFVFVTGGTLYDNTGWVQTSTVTAIGTAGNNIDFTQFSGAGTYTAGTGLTLTGSQFSVNASQTQITSVGTLGSLAVTGNANVGNLNASTAVVASTLTSNVATGTAPLTVTSTTRVNNLNVAQAGVADSINVAAGTGNNFIIFANAATGNVTELTSTGLTANLSNNSITATTFVGALSGTATTATNADAVLANFTSTTATTYLAGIGIGSNGYTSLRAVTGIQANLAQNSITATTFFGSLSGAATTAGTVTTAAQPNITSVGTLTSLAVTGTTGVTVTDSAAAASTAKILRAVNGTQDVFFAPRLGSGSYNNLVATDDIGLIFGNTSAQGNANITIAPWASANTGIRIQSVSNTATIFLNATTTNVSSALQVTNITTGANTTAGTVTGNWTLTAGSRWQATYADLAEKYAADATYDPGTVLLFGGEQEVTLSNAFDSTKVAGVVTTNPAYSMNAALEADHIAEIALQGRVPCKVIGPVSKGDLMVSATNGHAIANNEARAGTIIGKALENFNGESGIVEVAVGRF